ncbi:hypothetical protein AB6O49_10475 [Streptomyces sp. SBR177]|uniref:hypothetical protein n=1 Tax=Streptomyces sp. NPDC046275 TaxID=3157201 RepID=UPI003403514C
MSDPVTAEAVELVYTPTRAEVADACRVELRLGASRRMRWVLPLGATLAFLVVAADRLVGHRELAPVHAALLTGLGLVAGLLWPLTPWWQALWVYPKIARAGGYWARVSDGGLVLTTRRGELSGEPPETSPDANAYVETSRLFVLLSLDGAAGLIALPKRGLADPADVDRLRALLDRNITRL